MRPKHARYPLRYTEMKTDTRASGTLNWCLVTDSNGRPAG